MWDIGDWLQLVVNIFILAGFVWQALRILRNRIKVFTKTLTKLRWRYYTTKPFNKQHTSIDVTQLIRSQKELRQFNSMYLARQISYVVIILGMIVVLILNVVTVLYSLPDFYVDLAYFGMFVYFGLSAIVISVQSIRLRRKFTHPGMIFKVFRSQLKDIDAGVEDIFIPAEVDLPPSKEESIRKALLNHFPEQFFNMTEPEPVLWTHAKVFARSIHWNKITQDPRTLPESLIRLLASYERLEQLTIVVYRELRKESG